MTILNNPIAIKHLEMRNRMVFPPITTNYADTDGHVNETIIVFYEKRSTHVGLVIVEATAVNSAGRIVPNSLGLWNDDQIKGMSGLVDTIHNKGAVAVIQLNHAGPRCAPDTTLVQGFSPSGITFRPDIDPIIMSLEDIEQLAADFTRAASRAEEAGFDGIEIHGAHLYLLSQFLSPLTNQRTDQYGGDVDNRARLAVDIVRRVREKMGPEYPLFFRINAEERIKNGISLQESIETAKQLASAGVDVFDVTLIAHGGFKIMNDKTVLVGSSALSKDKPAGDNISFTKTFRKEIGLPVIAVGKLGVAAIAEQAIKQDGIDMIAVGRQMICDSDSVGKMLGQAHGDIIPCEECLACFASIGKAKPMACKVNRDLPF